MKRHASGIIPVCVLTGGMPASCVNGKNGLYLFGYCVVVTVVDGVGGKIIFSTFGNLLL
jgi:hypothetical protein